MALKKRYIPYDIITIMVKTIEWKKDGIHILDQRFLPDELRYIVTNDYTVIADAIRNLTVRGAPLIGITAAMGIAIGALKIKSDRNTFLNELNHIMDTMLRTRPTAVNIKWAVNRIKMVVEDSKDSSIETLKELIKNEALKILEEDIEVNKRIGMNGISLLRDGMNILTHCNAGALATGGYGTATAPVYLAKEKGMRLHVFVDETRPVLQGARLTAWEFIQEGIDCTLITDSSAGSLMKRGDIDIVIVGADRVARNGDVANKIGTYSLSVIAKENSIPFYVAAPLSSIDLNTEKGDDIPIEERGAYEITHIRNIRIAPLGVKVRNPAFDVTPCKYITGIITEIGILKPEDIKNLRI